MEVLKNTSVDINGTHFEFDDNGNPNIGYNLVQWVWNNSDLHFMAVGNYYKKLDINKSLFKWHTPNSEVISAFYSKTDKHFKGFMIKLHPIIIQFGFLKCCIF